MSALTSGMQAALNGTPGVVMFGVVEILLPSYSLRLIDGPQSLTIFGNTFTGNDATYGTLGSLDVIGDGADNTAPQVKLSLMPPTNVATAALADPAAQGSQLSIWVGVITPLTGAVVADPYLVFIGQLDVPTVMIRQNGRELQYTAVSAWERFFDQDEGARLNSPFHQSIWAGELGLEFVTSVQQQLPWGQDGPRPSLITDIKYKLPAHVTAAKVSVPGHPGW